MPENIVENIESIQHKVTNDRNKCDDSTTAAVDGTVADAGITITIGSPTTIGFSAANDEVSTAMLLPSTTMRSSTTMKKNTAW